MKINNTRILLALILLTLGSYFFSEQSESSVSLALMIFFALLKVLLVAIYFMELKKAHMAWLMVLGLVLITYTGFIFALMA